MMSFSLTIDVYEAVRFAPETSEGTPICGVGSSDRLNSLVASTLASTLLVDGKKLGLASIKNGRPSISILSSVAMAGTTLQRARWNDAVETQSTPSGTSSRLGAGRSNSMRLWLWMLLGLTAATVGLVLFGLDSFGAGDTVMVRSPLTARDRLPNIGGRAERLWLPSIVGGERVVESEVSEASTRELSLYSVNKNEVVSWLDWRVEPKWSRFCRTFRVGDRKDFLMVVAPMLNQMGLCPNPSGGFDVYWGYSLNSVAAFSTPKFKKAGVSQDALLNSVPLMMQVVGEKPSIATLQQDCERLILHAVRKPSDGERLRAPGWCSFTQHGFNARRETVRGPVRLQYSRLRMYTAHREKMSGKFPSIWILKSVLAYSQRGIQLVLLEKKDAASEGGLIRWAEEHMPRGDYTLQEYLAEPMLWRDRKFDMRVLALLTSVHPLRFYVLDHAFPKIATVPYTTAIDKLKDSCVHFRMPVCGRPVSPYPPSTDSPLFRDSLVPALRDRGDWDRRLYPAVYRVLLRVVLLARRELLGPDEELGRMGFFHRRVQVLQPDVIFDQSGACYVIEMNTNGFMVGDLHKEFFDTTAAFRSALEISGVNDYPSRQQYRPEATRLVREHCTLLPGNWEMTNAAVELLEDAIPALGPLCSVLLRGPAFKTMTEQFGITLMIDEWCHTGRWTPIWPPREESIYKEVRNIYRDVTRKALASNYWTKADGTLLRFARWLSLDVNSGGGEPRRLSFCYAKHQRTLENRTLPPARCTCQRTHRPPNNEDLRVALKKQVFLFKSNPSLSISEKKSTRSELRTRVPRLDPRRFRKDYVGLEYDARHDNNQTTREFEEYVEEKKPRSQRSKKAGSRTGGAAFPGLRGK